MKIPSRSHGLLSTEERALLRSLQGQDVFIAFSPWIDAAFDHIDCGPLSFALRSRPGFLVLDKHWEEDEKLDDFGWMTVSTAGRAKDVRYSEEGHPLDASMISLTPSSPIARVSIFRKRVSPDWEFDHALLFEHEERFRYAVSFEPSALQRLVVSFTEATISEALCNLRGEPV